MKSTPRRIAASGTLALAVGTATLGLAAGPAQAEVDLDAIVEDVTESGYHVDSKARYLRTDRALDLLRTAQGRAVPVFVVVVPAGNDAARILAQLPGRLERKGTYAVLAGDQLRVASTTLPKTQVNTAYGKAVKAYPGKPDHALIAFIRTLPVSKNAPPQATKRSNDGKPAPEEEPIERTLAESQPTGPATGSKAEKEAKKDDGLPIGYLLAGGAVVVLAGAGGGFLLMRRRKQAAPAPAQAVPAGAPAGPPAGPGAEAPRPGAPAPAAPAPDAPKPDAPQAPGTPGQDGEKS
ncbi:hypothetical protein [Spirillospora albida]|uniref:hypothetical protein n=1 Tax=Spirillospora albida TaxID=58123 RepID=UPI0004C11395|nr:hypothetical protein [Spirillospora albida]